MSTRLAPAGFVLESAWKLEREPVAGTQMLYECRADNGTHNFISTDYNCESRFPLGPVGYIYTSAAAGRIALYRCRVGFGTDHFVSTQQGCEGNVNEGLLGYALPG